MLRQPGNTQSGESDVKDPLEKLGSWKLREEPADQPGTAEKLEQLETVLRSQTLAGSPNLRVLLQYLVVKAIGGEEVHLKEYTIATEVFGRSGDFDSRTDSVVRVQAKRLRTKLQEYYELEGKSDKILIDVPKGHYSVFFSYIRNGPKVEDAPEIQAETVEASTALSRRIDKDKASRLAMLLSIIVLVIVVAVLALSYRDLRRQPRASVLYNAESEAGAVWRPFFSSDTPALVVISNPAVYRFSNAADPDVLVRKSVELTPEEARWLAETMKDRFVMRQNQVPRLILAPADYTGMGEAIGFQRIAELFRSAGKNVTLKQSRTVSAEDLKTYNVISLGSV